MQRAGDQFLAGARFAENKNGGVSLCDGLDLLEDLFQRRSAIENINAISGKDIVITKEGDRVVLSAEYSQCVPLVLNIRVCMDFTPTSAAK